MFLFSSWENFFAFLWKSPLLLIRDAKALIKYILVQLQFYLICRKNDVFITLFDRLATSSKFSTKTAIQYNGSQYQFRDVHRLSLKISNWIESQLGLGVVGERSPDGTSSVEDVHIGLMLGNIPETLCFLLGITRVRCTAVLFNDHNKLDTLRNAFQACKCKVFICELRYWQQIRDIAHDLPDIQFYMFDRSYEHINSIYDSIVDHKELPETKQSILDINANIPDANTSEKEDYRKYNGMSNVDIMEGNANFVNFAPILGKYEDVPVRRSYPYSIHDNIMCVYTSGTTGGKVKAAWVNNIRFLINYVTQKIVFNIKSEDSVYMPLPLYHSMGVTNGGGFCLLGGCTLTLADRFSVKRFWTDCKENKCTIAPYIGELARYLLAAPPSPADTDHSIRMFHGLGMKKDVWIQFTKRFNIGRICEFYGATEANFLTFNIEGVPGACGFYPYYVGFIARILFPVHLIKVDPITMEPMRNKHGLCELAGPGDVGILVGQIKKRFIYTKFVGYTSKEESNKKLLYDVLSKGHNAFITGDLFEMDACGNLFFKDRTGDTFRWKGENVSTTEVEAVAGKFLQNRDCAVYGVPVPCADGCAGMIAIKHDASNRSLPDLDFLYNSMKQHLPEYAMPKFVRFTQNIPTTSTYKLIKYQLKQVGFNPKLIDQGDQLFYFDKTNLKFKPLDDNVYDQIAQGSIQI